MRSKLITLYELVRNWPASAGSVRLPKQISFYTLGHNLTYSRKRPFVIGKYWNQNGEDVAIKLWKGKRHDRHYFSLKQEAKLLRLMNGAMKDVSTNGKLKISFPRYLDLIEQPGLLAMISEFVNVGDKSSHISLADKYVQIMDAVMNYLSKMSNQPSIRRKIQAKGGSYYLLLFPLLLLVACRNKPFHKGLLLKSAIHFYRNVWRLFGPRPLSIVHGDLHPDNMLLSGGKVYLLDCEQMMCTFGEYELITSLASSRVPMHFKLHLLTTIQQRNLADSTLHMRLNALAVFCAVFNLAGNPARANTVSNTRLLKMALTGQFNPKNL